MKHIEVTIAEARKLCMDVFRAKLVPNLISSPGVGKSDLAKDIAKKNKLKLIDVRLSQSDPADLQGFPMIIPAEHQVMKNNLNKIKAGYVPMEMFPIEGDEIPEGMNGWLVLLDEFNSAPKSVQAASYKLVLDRMVGMHRLHPRVFLMAAGNRITDKAIVTQQSTAMQSRLTHLIIKTCPKTWDNWADKAEIDHRVTSFIKFKPDLLHRFDPNHSDLTFPCPRTWESISKIIKPWKSIELEKIPLLAGTIGEGAAREFFSYSKVYGEIPTIEQILSNPEECKIGDSPSIHYALAGLVGHHMQAKNANTLIQFISRLGIDHQVSVVKRATAKDPTIKKTKGFIGWIAKNAEELVQ